eukprot:UN21487
MITFIQRKDKMQASSGYHEHWPKGRGIFVRDDKKFLNWLNEGDHIRIILWNTDQMSKLSWQIRTRSLSRCRWNPKDCNR